MSHLWGKEVKVETCDGGILEVYAGGAPTEREATIEAYAGALALGGLFRTRWYQIWRPAIPRKYAAEIRDRAQEIETGVLRGVTECRG